MLLRYFFSLKGRISANRYRAFLLWYLFAVLPIFTVLYFAFLVLGAVSKAGILRDASLTSAVVGSSVYCLGCFWPFIAATTRRMHDLGYRGRDYFFIVSPHKTWKLGKEILFKHGIIDENTHGSNPGMFE
ncbi:MAG: hypothetical protein JWQ35_454 [Bacteriovoracaceae bacterium]|nr:hypothetical protein [Bacteriovoracaceae bacterium]